jgi:site-specific recombinase XerC
MLAARDQAIFSLFLESFIRLDELAELNVEDIDIKQKRGHDTERGGRG